MDWLEVILRLGVATVAGMVVGIERELRHKPAGLRTHMLVCLGAAAAMLIALALDANASRVVQGVVTGMASSAPGPSCIRQGISKALPLPPASGPRP